MSWRVLTWKINVSEGCWGLGGVMTAKGERIREKQEKRGQIMSHVDRLCEKSTALHHMVHGSSHW